MIVEIISLLNSMVTLTLVLILYFSGCKQESAYYKVMYGLIGLSILMMILMIGMILINAYSSGII